MLASCEHIVQIEGKLKLKLIQLCSECNHVWIDLPYGRQRMGRVWRWSGLGNLIPLLKQTSATHSKSIAIFRFNDSYGEVEQISFTSIGRNVLGLTLTNEGVIKFLI